MDSTGMEVVPYAGWNDCIRLSNDSVELIVTKEVGPRVLRYGFLGGPNEFVEYADQLGLRGGNQYRSYGGHRLWVAPETAGWTDHPDNLPVMVSETDDGMCFTPPREEGTGLQKSIIISLPSTGPTVTVRHTLTNVTDEPIMCALWALSVMAPGGTAIIPHERFIPHGEKVLPARPMVLWHYADMTDPRWTWGKKFVRLRQSIDATTPQKFGVLTTDGWAAYANDGRIFLKHFPYDPAASYPDYGCNAEIFTNKKMLEVESLGPMGPLRPGETRSHTEQWTLFSAGHLPEEDDDLERLFGTYLQNLPR